MNVAVILDYFKYFIPFSLAERGNKYFYLTQRHRFGSLGIKKLIQFELNTSKRITAESPIGDPEYYFKATNLLNAISSKVTIDQLAIAYEDFFKKYLEMNKIELLLSGGVTGFERCGLFIARTLGVKTLCVWEGFFRPSTISFDPLGMNAESEFNLKSWKEVESHAPSNGFQFFYSDFISKFLEKSFQEKTLKDIHRSKFDILYQISNRLCDRNDHERIRLPIKDHLLARFYYKKHKINYYKISDIKEPFLFFPLQTHTDSNIAINSTLFPYEKYVDLIQNSFLKVERDLKCKLIIKEHPFDVLRKTYCKTKSGCIYWLDPAASTREVFNHDLCIGTLVVNSTAGLESLIYQKPVLTLGKAIYNRPELALNLETHLEDELTEKLKHLIKNRVNSSTVKIFCACLFDSIQFEGNIEEEPNISEIQRFEELIKR
jgi:capsule polysaccharide modification protein KpsS